MEACERIANALKIDLKDIGFAGSKDRNAVTEQMISIKNIRKERVDKLNDFERISLKYFGNGDLPITLGNLKGNEFIITLREVKKHPRKIDFFVNYFDDQRFSKNNVEVGKSLLKKDFKKASELIAKSHKIGLSDHLSNNPDDHIGIIRSVPKKILMLYIHSFQSYLWNECAVRYLQSKFDDFNESSYSLGKLVFPEDRIEIKIPLLGFDTEFDNEEIKNIYADLLKKEDISLRDFIIRQIPNLSSEGSARDLFVDIKDLKIDFDEKQKICKLNFTLSKGSYATIAVKSMFC